MGRRRRKTQDTAHAGTADTACTLHAQSLGKGTTAHMERKNAWKKYQPETLEQLDSFCRGYIDFISDNKTERECAATAIEQARKAGYQSLDELAATGAKLKAGDKVYAQIYGKALALFHLGTRPLAEGMNILGAHIDSPRLDVKQNPLYEQGDMAYLDTHYYGGVKKYQWTARPLAIHGVVVKTDGTSVPLVIGEDPSDPVFCVSELLIHLSAEQLQKTGAKVVEGEDLDLLVGGRPLQVKGAGKDTDTGREDSSAADADSSSCGCEPCDPKKEPFKAFVLSVLDGKYGIAEEDFISAELEIVPAGRARELGFDRSMILGYGQDDRVCAYTSLMAQLEVVDPERTAVTLLVDKEEIGSVGATGMHSRFFEDAVAEVCALTGESDRDPLCVRRALRRSRMLSSDVSAGYDPLYASVFESKNSAFMGRGLVFNKYTGARGKSGSNDANAEFVARVRRVMDDAGVSFQTCELGKVDAGGGGTIAYIMANYGMEVIDSGVPVLSMHAPWEVSNKADVYEAFRGYTAFLLNA